jgi:DNA invertase Pin-like site-specific DNA recombinase/uncharacterized coiled-coil protein SlyX
MDDRLKGNGAYYIRVSTDDQDTARQHEAIGRWLKANKLTIAPHFRFEDHGFERDRPELRPDFQRMMRMIENGTIQWIVADAQDRFGTKDKYQFIFFMHLLRRAGCNFFTIDGKCWTDDSMVAFLEGGIGADTSEKEQRNKSHRILEDKLLRAKRGEWQGGHLAFGMDVVCIGPDGQERWRVELDGRKLTGTKPGRGGKKRRVYSLRRTKIFPDGRRERFDGHRHFPASEADEHLEQRPSNDENKLAVVREIFAKFSTEAISPTQLAAYLNKLGVKHYYAPRWQHYHVREMLSNPIYTGYQRWNSNGQGRFTEFIAGEERQVKDRAGRRARAKEDWVLSDRQLFEPVVPKDVWDKVQLKIETNPPKRRDPRSPDLWLAGLLVCSHCGKPMRGMQRPTRTEYFCSTYAESKDNETCLRNCVNHEVVEGYIRQYLKDSHREAVLLLEVEKSGNFDLLKPYHEKHRQNLIRFAHALGRTVDAVTSHPDWEDTLRQCGANDSKKNPPQTLEEFHDEMKNLLLPVQEAYRFYFRRDEVEVRRQLDELEQRHTNLAQRMLNFDPAKAKRAIEKANDQLAELEKEIERVQGRLKNWADEFDKIRDETTTHIMALDAAEAALEDPAADNRRKAQAVRACIQQVNLTFRPTGKKYPKSELVAVEIIPASPPEPEHPNGGSSCKAPALLGRRSRARSARPRA